MTHITTYCAASGARLPAALSVHIVEELHCYDEYLRDVRGLAAGTRKGRLRVVGLLLQEKFKGRAIQIGKLRPDDIRQFLAGGCPEFCVNGVLVNAEASCPRTG